MPRQARLIVPGVPLHVIQRGNNRTKCFLEEADFLVYSALLREAVGRYEVSLHAYCLMSNHVHLLFTSEQDASCGALMHRISQRYAYYFNRKYSRTGTLWEGRFRSCVVQSRHYVLECHRYVELNPVRAGIVNDPLTYPWSSHGVNSGVGTDAAVSHHPEIMAIGFRAYRALVSEAMKPALVAAIREATNSGYPLGGEQFLAVLSAAGRKVAKAKAGRPLKDRKSVAVPDF